MSAEAKPVWQRCGCDQWGRCLVDCPTAHLPFWATPIGKRLGMHPPVTADQAQEPTS